MAQDCSHFVVKFFEPINISATHIYHSALEWSPISSIIRKLYYDRCHGTTRFPKIAIGTPDFWEPTVSFSGNYTYRSCTLSPCGRFVAAQTIECVQIRNQLTFELLSVLKSTGNISLSRVPRGPLAYSPDGRSLACGFPRAIVIWDIQTGGVAKEIKCSHGIQSLVWSLDGRSIAATFAGSGSSTPCLRRYDVASGAQPSTEEPKLGILNICQLWAYEKTFRFMYVKPESRSDDPTIEISIFEIGPTLIEIESHMFTMPFVPQSSSIAFSPSTHRVSFTDHFILHILDIRSSECLLEEKGYFTSPQFSSDGGLFATSRKGG